MISEPLVNEIWSGGQAGVDRAALFVAKQFRIQEGGWCPKYRRAEDGYISDAYQLQETISTDVNVRTKLNIQKSDGTLIIVEKIPTSAKDGTIYTIDQVKKQEKPYLTISLSKDQDNNISLIEQWIKRHKIKILNIAGPRESQCAGIYRGTVNLLTNLITSKPYLFLIKKRTISKL